jgi:hypothetical protein
MEDAQTMTIRILSHVSKDEPVKTDLIITTVEKNRDRIRATSGMVITTSGILISACLGIILFTTDKKLITETMAWAFGAALGCFLCASVLAVLSSVLRTEYGVSSEAQFVSDLLKIFGSELRLSRLALGSLLLGLAATVCGAIAILAR